MNLFGQNIKAMKACIWFLFPSLLILRLCVASQSCMSHRLWVIYPGTCLRVWDVSWGLLEDVWFRIVPYLQGFCLGRGAVSYQVCFNTVMEQSERQLSSYWQMVVCVCVCVCSCLHLGEGSSLLGEGKWSLGRKRRWRVLGRGQQRHSWWDPQSNQLLPQKKPVSSLPAWMYVPVPFLLFSVSNSLPPAFPLSCPLADSAQLFQPFYSPVTMHLDPLARIQKNKTKQTCTFFNENTCVSTFRLFRLYPASHIKHVPRVLMYPLEWVKA